MKNRIGQLFKRGKNRQQRTSFFSVGDHCKQSKINRYTGLSGVQPSKWEGRGLSHHQRQPMRRKRGQPLLEGAGTTRRTPTNRKIFRAPYDCVRCVRVRRCHQHSHKDHRSGFIRPDPTWMQPNNGYPPTLRESLSLKTFSRSSTRRLIVSYISRVLYDGIACWSAAEEPGFVLPWLACVSAASTETVREWRVASGEESYPIGLRGKLVRTGYW